MACRTVPQGQDGGRWCGEKTRSGGLGLAGLTRSTPAHCGVPGRPVGTCAWATGDQTVTHSSARHHHSLGHPTCQTWAFPSAHSIFDKKIPHSCLAVGSGGQPAASILGICTILPAAGPPHEPRVPAQLWSIWAACPGTEHWLLGVTFSGAIWGQCLGCCLPLGTTLHIKNHPAPSRSRLLPHCTLLVHTERLSKALQFWTLLGILSLAF